MKDFLGTAPIVAAMVFAGTFTAGAQVAQPDSPSTQAAPEHAPRPATPQGAQAPQQGSADLSHSQGVLTPPDIHDPAVKVPNRPTSPRTPVIPPPGTPGGRRNVEPK